jgi:hypothetical protein
MKPITIGDSVKLGKVMAEVCLVIAYGTIKLSPVLAHRAVTLAVPCSLIASVWVLRSPKEIFHRSAAIVRKPFLSLIASVVCYSILQFSIDFLDYHTPPAEWGSLADIFIELLFALSYLLLSLSVCSFLRELGIDPFEYLREFIKGREENR